LGILCGVDIIEIERVKKSLDCTGTAFRDKVFTKNEIDYCEGRNVVKYQSYAARFAAKEAVTKAFGTGIGSGIVWKEVEILNKESGKPYVVLSGKAKEQFNKIEALNMDLSLSHCNSYAIAYFVIYTK